MTKATELGIDILKNQERLIKKCLDLNLTQYSRPMYNEDQLTSVQNAIQTLLGWGTLDVNFDYAIGILEHWKYANGTKVINSKAGQIEKVRILGQNVIDEIDFVISELKNKSLTILN